MLDLRDARYAFLPFFEAYFSNFIEGTEFELVDAVAIGYEHKQVAGRADDSHDLVGTYHVVADDAQMSERATAAGEFVQMLRARHATILAGRPNKRPGQFKEAPDRVGSSSFVLPGYVTGTLHAGWQRLAELDTAFERAVYMMFLVAAGQSRIIIPTVFRDDYLGGLRRLSRQDDASVLIKALRFAQDYVAQIDFTSLAVATAMLTATHAFNEAGSSERLHLPSESAS